MRTGKYVIGFRDSDRINRFFERNGVIEEVALVPGVYGKNLPWTLVKQSFDRTFVEHQLKVKGAAWLHGTLGCLLSHIKAIEQAFQDDRDLALIAEDDAYFRASPEPLFSMASGQAFDLVYLNDRMYPGQRQLNNSQGITRLSAANLRGTGAEGYIISRRAAEVLLEQFASGIRVGMPSGYDGFLQSTALVKGDSVDKPGGKSLVRWLEHRSADLKVGVALPTIVAHEDAGISLICGCVAR